MKIYNNRNNKTLNNNLEEARKDLCKCKLYLIICTEANKKLINDRYNICQKIKDLNLHMYEIF